jgi:hypothetical protein
LLFLLVKLPLVLLFSRAWYVFSDKSWKSIKQEKISLLRFLELNIIYSPTYVFIVTWISLFGCLLKLFPFHYSLFLSLNKLLISFPLFFFFEFVSLVLYVIPIITQFFLILAKLESWTQKLPSKGTWLSRPLTNFFLLPIYYEMYIFFVWLGDHQDVVLLLTCI